MIMQEWENPDEYNKKIAKQESWLCGLFAEEEIDVNDKKSILKDLMKDFKTQQDQTIQ